MPASGAWIAATAAQQTSAVPGQRLRISTGSTKKTTAIAVTGRWSLGIEESVQASNSISTSKATARTELKMAERTEDGCASEAVMRLPAEATAPAPKTPARSRPESGLSRREGPLARGSR